MLFNEKLDIEFFGQSMSLLFAVRSLPSPLDGPELEEVRGCPPTEEPYMFKVMAC
jgi:hypothetical protein